MKIYKNLLININNMRAEPDLGGSLNTARDEFLKIFGLVTPIIGALGAMFIIFKLVQLGIKLAQSGDEPEERSKVIKGLIWWGVGLLITVAAVIAVPTIIYGLFGITVIK